MSKTIEELMNIADETQDQSVQEGGDFVYELPAEGVTVGRLIEYIELGKQPQKPYQGKAKPPHTEVRLTFELLAPKNIKEIEIEGEGKKKITEKISIRITDKLGEKASFQKLRQKLIYGRPFNHVAKCLGSAYVINIVHNKGKADPNKTYANVQKDGEWLISPPFKIDPLTNEKQTYNVPANMSPLKIFLFNNPTKETWDSLFIDGTREVKDGDKVTQVSKNWLQEVIMSATDFPGSALQLMLGAVTEKDLPMTEQVTTEALLDDEIPFDSPSVDNQPAPDAELDAMAALGLK